MGKLTYAVIGAGAGGESFAAILGDKGYDFRLMDSDAKLVEAINKKGSLTLTGELNISVRSGTVTTDIAEALEGADIIMVATTACDHEDVAKAAAPHIRAGQVVVLNPGMLMGALSFKTALKEHGCPHDIPVAEAQDLVFTCRKTSPGEVFHSAVKKKMPLAAVPAGTAAGICDVLNDVFPQFFPVENILHTGLSSIGPALHCVPMIMNANKIELGQAFDYYIEGMTPCVARIAERVDGERVRVAEALGISVADTASYLKDIYGDYGASGGCLYEVIQSNRAYIGIPSPPTLSHRFLAEDTYGSLVPLASIARELGVPTPGMDAVIQLIGMVTGTDYMSAGRTARKMGLSGKTAAEIRRAVS